MSKTTKAITLGVILAFLSVILVPVLLRTFAMGLKGEFDPDTMKNKIDTRTCEFILTPKRDDSFLKCPVPEDYKIPNWPDKKAPLNSK